MAVALPTPGSASSSSADAVFRSTGPDAAAFSAFEGFSALSAFSAASVFAGFSAFELFSGFEPDFSSPFTRPAFATGLSFSISDSETPARARSLIDEYGRPAMIFAAVAGPIPGRASSSCWVAVLTSTFCGAADAVSDAASRTASAATAIRAFSRIDPSMSTSSSASGGSGDIVAARG